MIALEFVVIATMMLGLLLSARQLVLAARALAEKPAPTTDCVDRLRIPAPADMLWPTVTIIVAAHNEERVIAGCLKALAALDYPRDKFSVLVVNDRSTDATGPLADEFAHRDASVSVFHRQAEALPGKSAAVADAMNSVSSEIVVLFDADYLPQPKLLKQLVVPFFDPAVGATMGRVAPYNSDANVLTKLLDLERRAGYAVDQNARALWRLTPQFGGTVGGIRMQALKDVGGWKVGHLAEDTDLTFRLILKGWKIAYLNHAPCYEEVPEDWQSRFRQVRRWAYGHNQCLMSYFASVLLASTLRPWQKLDALLILLFYFFPFAALFSLAVTILLLAYGPSDGLVCHACAYLTPLISVAVLSPYSQAAVAALKDQQPHVLRVLPLLPLSSTLSLIASCVAFVLLLRHKLIGDHLAWDKTRRFRSA